MKILIVEDDPAIIHLFSSCLKRAGFQVLTAPDAIQGSIGVLRDVPALVLLDVNMPGGTGRAAVRSMKNSRQTRHVPIVVMSADDSPALLAEMKGLGVDECLQKPVQPEELLRHMNRLLGIPQAAGESPCAGVLESQNLNLVPGHLPSSSRMKVLIADDDPGVRLLLGSLLRKWEYEPVTAADGIAAWQVLQQEDPPKIAVLDWMMPGLDGLSICHRMRNALRETYTYIILISSKGQKRDLVQGLEAGADDYMTKPLEASELRLRLDSGRRIIELRDELIEARIALQALAKTVSLGDRVQRHSPAMRRLV